uniref:Uncharacterized protein n=1 Tax=Arundo donax TaxID=35708 RepID=A0A0A9B6E5_ARUDO
MRRLLASSTRALSSWIWLAN